MRNLTPAQPPGRFDSRIPLYSRTKFAQAQHQRSRPKALLDERLLVQQEAGGVEHAAHAEALEALEGLRRVGGADRPPQVRRAGLAGEVMGAGDVDDLLAQFEDADEPIGGVLEGLDERVAEAVGRVDPDGTLPAVQMMGAVITYLGYRRDEVTDVEADILRLAARAEYDGDPPAVIEEWLADQGVTL